jgi:hypothetical protein
MVPLPIMKIFIHLVVVFILVYVIICLTNFPPVAFLAFFWDTAPLTKDSVVLTLPPLGYISPAMLNLMKLTFPSSIPLRLNLYPPSNFQIFWNPVFPLQTCHHLPLHLIPRIFHNPDLTRVILICTDPVDESLQVNNSLTDPSLPPSDPSPASLELTTKLPTPAPVAATSMPSHPMLTRAKAGIFKTRHPADLALLRSSGLFSALLAST